MEFIENIGKSCNTLTDYRNLAALFPKVLERYKFYKDFIFRVSEGWRQSVIYRGKPAEQEFIKHYFSYINSLGRLYRSSPKNVNIVLFDESRYGRHTGAIYFLQPVSERTAIVAAESYLGRRMTQEHFDIVKDDLFAEPIIERFEYFGDVLGNARYLERVEITDWSGPGTLELSMGS